jgi:hypothetical protein
MCRPGRKPAFWGIDMRYLVGGSCLCVAGILLVGGLLVQRAGRRRAEGELRASRRERRRLAGRLIEAQEVERLVSNRYSR